MQTGNIARGKMWQDIDLDNLICCNHLQYLCQNYCVLKLLYYNTIEIVCFFLTFPSVLHSKFTSKFA